MVKFLKPYKAVVLLQGRITGHRATIVKNFDDGTRDPLRPLTCSRRSHVPQQGYQGLRQ